jgi:CcmD family protein
MSKFPCPFFALIFSQQQFKNMSIKNRLLATLLGIVALLLPAYPAQAGNGDFMRETGKIYVVVAVILVIFLGIALYLFRLDRKLTILEHQFKNSSDERKN